MEVIVEGAKQGEWDTEPGVVVESFLRFEYLTNRKIKI
jgi:hypothetical protein